MISAVVLTKESAKTLSQCLKALDFCDEILIIDDYSTDDTLKIAGEYKAKVFKHHLNDDFAGARNFGLREVKGNWVLFIDSDEEVSPALKAEILGAVSNEKIGGYYLKRKDFFMGTWLRHGETSNVSLLRLARKGKGQWNRKVHEIWQIEGLTGQLSQPILHYPHLTISTFLKQINHYSTLHAASLQKEGQTANCLTIFLKPAGKLFKNYILLGGFMDGTAGLVMALMMSFHSFLSQAKLWQLQQKRGL